MATMAHMELITRRAVRTRSNVMFLSPPARGKTAEGKRIEEEMLAGKEIDYVTHFDGGTLAPTDVMMSMPDMQELCIQQLRDKRLPNAHDTPELRGIINVGEWMLMGLEVSRGFQKLVNHEELGGFRIPDGVIFRSDGNRLQDKSGGQQQSRAIMSRFEVYELDYDSDYALDVVTQFYHPKVGAFLKRNPQLIDNYEDVFENDKRQENDITYVEGKRYGAWANLRAWDKVSRKLHDQDASGVIILPDEFNACVGSGVAGTFSVFLQMIEKLATLEDVINNPKKAEVPERMDERYALAYMLALTVRGDTFPPVSIYLNRFPDELQAAFMRLMNDRLAKLGKGNGDASAIRTSTEYRKWIVAPHISNILLGAATA
jgi:hypothetical protein